MKMDVRPQSFPMIKFIIFLVLISIPILFYLIIWEQIRVPPKSYTKGTMQMLVWRIHKYYETTGELPLNLSKIPERKGYDNSLKDGWGKSILYRINPDNSVTLVSYGKNKKVGGVGDNADIEISFNPRFLGSYYRIILGKSELAPFTVDRLESVREKILEYIKHNSKLPATLEDLSPIDEWIGLKNNQDYWGNEIYYSVEKGVVTLKSLGEDGKVGGKGENEDIVMKFQMPILGKKLSGVKE